tara:strand:- start:14618 stop:15058 length:441 start_codon:yes stop_codon:yes gene_type:complete
MTDKELQDLIRLKKYEQPEDGYFDDFLVEFQQRQRSEMLKTSARGLLIERAKAWFYEFGAMRWVLGAGAAYATLALVFNFIPSEKSEEPAMGATFAEGVNMEENIISTVSLEDEDSVEAKLVSMAFINPVDFSAPAAAFSADERIF